MARIGEKWVWFDAEVVNVKDPHKSGRVQIRVKGYHDDKTKIPDKDLPWAQVLMPVSSASVNKVGASPTGLLPKSKVIGFWYDANDMRIPFIMGSYVSAGELDNGGKTQGGKTPPKEPTNSGNPLNRPNGKDDAGGDRNPKPLKNPLEPNTERKNDSELPKTSITEVAKQGLKFPDLKTIGSLAKMPGGILQTILKVDPGNAGGAIPPAVENILGIQALSSLSNPSGIFGLASQALQSLMQKSSKELSQNQSVGMNNILDTIIQFVQSGEFAKLSDNNKTILLEAIRLLSENPNEPVIPRANTAILDTLTNGINEVENPTDVINAVCTKCIEDVFTDLLSLLRRRDIQASQIELIFSRLLNCLETNGQKAAFGNNGDNQNLSEIAQMLFSLGSNVLNSLNVTLPKSVNDVGKIKEALNKFTKNQARLKKKEDKAKAALQGEAGKSDLDAAREIAQAKVAQQVASGATSGSVSVAVGNTIVTQSYG